MNSQSQARPCRVHADMWFEEGSATFNAAPEAEAPAKQPGVHSDGFHDDGAAAARVPTKRKAPVAASAYQVMFNAPQPAARDSSTTAGAVAFADGAARTLSRTSTAQHHDCWIEEGSAPSGPTSQPTKPIVAHCDCFLQD